ncbi:MAG: methyl-accepting chemotaxis protein [Deltaproteobacteria bacterium]|nr:methyl-accepting chemotaxis protein [Deltaproteobacteria bacterium]
MKLDKLDTTGKRLGLIIGAILIMMLAAVGSTYWFVSTQRYDARVIDTAAGLKTLTQKMTKEVVEIARFLEYVDKVRKVAHELMMVRTYLADAISKQTTFSLNDETILFAPARAGRGIAERFNETSGWQLKQTSLKIRNPKNAPDEFEKTVLSNFEKNPNSQEYYEVVKEGEQHYIRYMKKLVIAKGCLKCHGDKNTFPPYISLNYKTDEAFDYKEGDVRGAISVKAPIINGVGKHDQNLKNDVSLFEATLTVLRDGGDVTNTDGSKLSLPKQDNETIVKKLDETIARWREFKGKLDIITAKDVNVDSVNYTGALAFVENNNETLLSDTEEIVRLLKEDSEKKNTFLKGFQVSSIFGVLAMAIVSGYFSNRWITKPVFMSSQTLADMARGDFSQKANMNVSGDFAKLEASLNFTMDNLNSVLKKVASVSDSIATASEELTATTHEIARGTKKQTESMDAVLMSTDQLNNTALEVERHSTDTFSHTSDVVKKAAEGSKMIEKNIAKMTNIATNVKASLETIGELGKNSKKIDGILSVIKDIADQTNLLALNASIEAARAGDYGRGFAVVADEVKKLSERTARSTIEIEEMVVLMRRNTSDAIAGMESTAAEVIEGERTGKETMQVFNTITESINRTNSMVENVTTAMKGHGSMTKEIGVNMENIAMIAGKNSKATEENAKASEDILKLVVTLRDLVSKFKLS